MKVDIGISIPQSETHGILELKTNTKKDKAKSKEMVCPLIEDKGNDWVWCICYLQRAEREG